MILILIGTKAQLIKMAPVILEMDRQSVPYLFVLTGQHKETMADLIHNFGLRDPDHCLVGVREASTSLRLAGWLTEIVGRHVLTLKKEPWIRKTKICLVHGDTLSTLIGALIAKRFNVKVAHVEAGLRSNNYLHPFPEEFIRVIISRLADIFYCPGDWAAENLRYHKNKNRHIINTKENTLLDAVRYAVKNKIEPASSEKYGVVSIHRFENLYNGERFDFILNQVEKISKLCSLYFVLHPATKEKLLSRGRYRRLLTNPGIKLCNRMDFLSFIRLTGNSAFLITDGGSNQEESSYLGLPCLLMRKATERKEGLNRNVILSNYNSSIIDDFIENALRENKKTGYWGHVCQSPSEIIVNDLKTRLRSLSHL
jgi:UDP-N-acetylglucosamine 2-epimerase (non-hydrolysing)